MSLLFYAVDACAKWMQRAMTKDTPTSYSNSLLVQSVVLPPVYTLRPANTHAVVLPPPKYEEIIAVPRQ